MTASVRLPAVRRENGADVLGSLFIFGNHLVGARPRDVDLERAK